MLRHGNWGVILGLESIQREVVKIIKKRVKDCSYREKLNKFVFTSWIERRRRSDRIQMFKIIEFLIMVDIFSKFLLELKI